MSSLEPMLALLVKLLREPSTRKATLDQFQSLVWDGDRRDLPVSDDVFNVLADLAHDLDYFVADPIARIQHVSYYGDERLEVEVKAALRRLTELGIEGLAQDS